jgi:hypothetical protein
MRRVPALLCALLVCAGCSEPPQKEISEAHGAIDAARAAGAEQYAAAAFGAATTALKESQDAVQQRDYRLALSRAIDANQRAQEAAKLAAEGMARARSDAEASIAAAATALQQLEARLKAAEAARVQRRDIAAPAKTAADAAAALQKARASLQAGDYIGARAPVKDLIRPISEQISAVDEAIAARAGRPARRRR